MTLNSFKGCRSLPRVVESPHEGRMSEEALQSKKNSMEKDS